MNQFSSSLLLFILLLLLSFASFTISSDEVVLSNLHYAFKNYHELRLPSNVFGPESLAFDCDGDGPYTGVNDGRIFKWRPAENKWIEFAVNSPHRDRKLCDGSTDPNNEPICGRPLGLKFEPKTCNLYIADAYYGLLMVGPNGGVAQQLAISGDDGVPFQFLNGLDIDEQTGIIYFSDSSAVYQRRIWRESMLNGDKTGRLLKYDSSTKKVQVLLKDLPLPNGVALNKDASFIMVAESGSRKIQKFWLKGPKAYTLELLIQLERIPDNVKRNKNGDFWVGLHRKNPDQLQYVDTLSLQNQAHMYEVSWKKEEEEKEDHVGVKFDEKGNILEIFDGRGGQQFDSISEVEERNGMIWIGSESNSYVTLVKVNKSFSCE